jgi:hypothetical protein
MATDSANDRGIENRMASVPEDMSRQEEEDGELQKYNSLPPPPVNGKIRYDVLHLFGTEEMSTDDVKRFFDTYDPHYKLEWVSDSACELLGEWSQF